MPTAKVNGAEIYYEERGSGPPIILSPGGLNFSLEPFRAVIEGLSQKHRAIGYDRRFGGRSKSPLVVQTWDLCSNDVMGLMDALGIEQAYLGGGSFGPGISMGCAARYPHRVRGLILSNMVGGIIPTSYLAARLFRSGAMAVDQGMRAVIEAAFDPDDRCAPFLPDRAQSDPEFRKELEAMDPEEFYQIMNDTIRALFDGPYPTFGMTVEMLKATTVPTLITPGHNDRHPREVAELVHRLIPNSQWAEIPPEVENSEKYVHRVSRFIADVEAGRSSQ